jgi:acetylornithine/succinyldiaminopimelate/putrescine aminotransferase
MLTIKRGQHGSTYGGNPIAAAVGKAALEVRLFGVPPLRVAQDLFWALSRICNAPEKAHSP